MFASNETVTNDRMPTDVQAVREKVLCTLCLLSC